MPMNADELQLGAKYRDTVSGWEGIATARFEYLNGCVRVDLSGADDKGAPISYVFDVEQVELVDAGLVREPRRGLFGRTGGPRDTSPPPRR